MLSQLGRGNYFGERALMGGEVRNAKNMLQRSRPCAVPAPCLHRHEQCLPRYGTAIYLSNGHNQYALPDCRCVRRMWLP